MPAPIPKERGRKMNVTGISKVQVLSKPDPTPSKDGTKKYYKLAVLQASEAGMISVNEDVFNFVQTGKEYELATRYNDQYKSFSVFAVVNLKDAESARK